MDEEFEFDPEESNLRNWFNKHEDEFLKFDNVENKFSKRSDLHAFILLDKLFPDSESDMVCAAEHDEIYLDVNEEELNNIATEEVVIELIRCGVRLGEYGLCMFV